jgi:hypothetical protein
MKESASKTGTSDWQAPARDTNPTMTKITMKCTFKKGSKTLIEIEKVQ